MLGRKMIQPSVLIERDEVVIKMRGWSSIYDGNR